MSAFDLSELKPLTSAARDRSHERAIQRVRKLAGPKPERRQFAIEHGALFGVLDWLALFVFLSALSISSLNIIAHMGRLASAAYAPSPAGIRVSPELATVIYQVASIPLAEFSMLAFLVAFGLARGWRRWVYLALAGLATAFILLANATSGVGHFEAALPALFTIGTGLRLEYLVIEGLRRRQDVAERYRAALAHWSAAQTDPEQHPHYATFLRQELWEHLLTYKDNRRFVDAPHDFKRAAVEREIRAMRWADDVPFPGALRHTDNGRMLELEKAV